MAILVFRHSQLVGSERLGEALRDYGHQLRVISLHEGDAVPPDLDDVDGILACGGSPSIAGDAPAWLEPEMALIREADARQMPVIGICLGHQIVARALGGTVTPMDGIELGWQTVELNHVGREDPLHAGLPWTMRQFHWHRQQVSELPDGARLLASSEACPVQAWARGLRTYGFQYHAEVHRRTIDRWVADEPHALGEAGTTEDALRRETELHYPEFERLTQRLFESMALFLNPVDRRYQGLVKDLHH